MQKPQHLPSLLYHVLKYVQLEFGMAFYNYENLCKLM